ncbi:MAG: ATP-binding protein [Vicinamibacterales bacterium]
MTTAPSRALLEALWDAAESPVVVSSADGIVYATQAFSDLLGEPVVTGARLESLAKGVHVAAVGEVLRAVLDGRESRRAHETAMRAADDSSVPVEHVARAIEVGTERLVVSTFVPVADRNRMADALGWSEQRYRDLFEEDTDGRFVVTPDWRLIDCNAVLARALGYDDREPLIGQNLMALTPDGPVLQKLLAVARVDGRAGAVELQMTQRDGTPIDVSCLVSASFGPGRTVVSLRGQVAEITARKRLETRLQGAERMEMIGRLAGGLAHDFNNLLTVISGNTERLLAAIPSGDPLKNAVTSIDEAASRAASMTRQLLAYGRRQVFESRPLSLTTLIASLQPQLAEILGDHITVEVGLPADVPQISADPRQIEHVIANLALNAREAMPSGGSLSITVDAMDVSEHVSRERLWLRPGRYARLRVSDTGSGMDPVTKAYAFQPFFTTKRMGNGRGLGLATVYGIVKQSHGFVWVDSEPDHGATFTLLFPTIKSGTGSVRSSADPAQETILVVEADASARSFVGDALRRRGYRVLVAATPREAIETLASQPVRVHLVVSGSREVTDQGIPLVARLQAIDPLLQSLITLEPSERDENARVLPTTPRIQKPFTLQALADKIREALDSGEGRA